MIDDINNTCHINDPYIIVNSVKPSIIQNYKIHPQYQSASSNLHHRLFTSMVYYGWLVAEWRNHTYQYDYSCTIFVQNVCTTDIFSHSTIKLTLVVNISA